ncbi:MAG: ABC transporter permease [Pirellulales bacterium]|jgi:ABC-type transport system involved in multi-copper enzyme maturation permease subunit
MDRLAGNVVLFGELSTWLKPLWLVGVGALIAVAALFLAYGLLRLLFPKVAAIALTTTKEVLAQPLFYVVLTVGAFAIIAFPFVPYYTFGEDVKVVKDTGLTVIMLLGIILAVWTASVSISEEIEGRTALTLLSKPISRRQFVIGKFLGIIGPTAILFIFLGVMFLASVSYKVVYDARETGYTEPSWLLCRYEMLQVAPGLLLAFLETVVLTSISVAISTRLPMLANLIICFTVYALGHLVPMLVDSPLGQFPIVTFMGNLFAVVLPNLDNFNVWVAIAGGRNVPNVYLGLTALYALIYSTAAMFLALALFEDRDLA